MGLLVAYTAAMQRVLIGLECQGLYSVQEDEHQRIQEERCGGEGEEQAQEDDRVGSREQARVAAAVAAFAPLSARLARHCRVSIAPEALREMSADGGEFMDYAATLIFAAEDYCEASGDDEILDGAYQAAVFFEAARAAARRFDDEGGVSPAELKQRPKTLEMFVLRVAHRIAARMRTKAVRKS